jgi:tetratricopeptide (TPR) repeat protein
MEAATMSKTLNLVERLLARGRKFQQLGLEQEAARCWDRLAGLSQLPPEVAREAQTQLAEIHLDRGRFARARRHLSAALLSQPGNSHFHYLLAKAIEADDRGDRNRALHHYRQAIDLDPEQPHYLCRFGLLALELGQTEDGLKSLRRALELAPDDPEVVSRVADGLRQEDAEEARAVVRAALFRNPRHARFHKIWSDFHFDCLREEQQRRRVAIPVQEGPTLLPFVRPEPAVTGPQRLRRDPPSRPARPHFPVSHSRKKHA